jgi:hypothetical protein
VDFLLYAYDRVLAIEAKAGHQAHRTDARPLVEVLKGLAPRGVAREAWRLGLVVHGRARGGDARAGVWAVPDWRLFGPAG